jgi:hypothetical protein
MAETGWPLIPREVLPAPVAAVRRAKRMPVHVDGGRQLSIFGAETTEPSPADLAGLLAGPGRLGRMGGTARVSVDVDAAWRVHVLVSELVARGLVVSWLPIHQEEQDPEEHDSEEHDPDLRETGVPESDDEPGGHTEADSPDGPEAAGSPGSRDSADGPDEGSETPLGSPGPVVTGFEVRTAYSSRLNGLARGWPPPSGKLFLSGPRLRLWVAAAGEPRPGGYALGLDPVDNPEIADAALVRAGLAGTVSDQGLCYLISGKKRLRRLAELVGERPVAAPEQLWPGGAAA